MSYFDRNSYHDWEINPPAFYEFNNYHIGHDYISQNCYPENCSYHDNQGRHNYSDFSLNQPTEMSFDEKLDVLTEMLQNSSEMLQNQLEKWDKMISQVQNVDQSGMNFDNHFVPQQDMVCPLNFQYGYQYENSFSDSRERETEKNDELKFGDLSTFNNFLYDETETSYLNVESYGQKFESTSMESPITQSSPISELVHNCSSHLYNFDTTESLSDTIMHVPFLERKISEQFFHDSAETKIGEDSEKEIKEMICKETEHVEYIDPFLLEPINFSQLASPCFDPPCDGLKITETIEFFIEESRDISLFCEPTINSLPNHVVKLGLFEHSFGSPHFAFSENKLLTWDYQRDRRWRISISGHNFVLSLHALTDPSLQDFRLRLFVPKDFKSVLL